MALNRPRVVVGLGLLAVAALALDRVWTPPRSATGRAMERASYLMAEAERAVRACRESRGLTFDPDADPNGTGLIGLEASPLTTSLGNPAAKRTTTNPDFAALLVLLLRRAGVGSGDAVAVGASSSFPALVVATIAACRALDSTPLVIFSLGASQWGQNDPRFDGLDLTACLVGAGFPEAVPIAVSLGGERDSGSDMAPGGRASLRRAVAASGLSLLEESDLARNVAARLAFYESARRGRRLAAFVNIGGNWANLGEEASVLEVKPGLVRSVPPVRSGRGGVLHAFAGRGVPVIHLLHIAGICREFGLPWDPRPLPAPGRGGLEGLARQESRRHSFIALGYILVTLVVLAVLGKDPLWKGKA
ncbi:MAG: poly-gamma-glutamate system protein [Candidatus Aminicenantes bacterium]|nr:poly-gamma-glutamate system protein [Candidatus Aminicenantes bacterium]